MGELGVHLGSANVQEGHRGNHFAHIPHNQYVHHCLSEEFPVQGAANIIYQLILP